MRPPPPQDAAQAARAGRVLIVGHTAMDSVPSSPPLPAEYYRRHAARVRRLANEATTSAVKGHLHEVALEYERLAERVDSRMPATEP